MRIPQSPPDWQTTISEDPGALARLLNPRAEALIRAANNRYLHWDKFRFREMPKGVTARQAWAGIAMTRMAQRQSIPVTFGRDRHLWYWIPPQHHEWISLIDQRAGGAIASRQECLPEDSERYLFNSLMEEAIASSQLEGANTTREVAKEMLRTSRQPRDRAEQMIANNYQAILEIRELKEERLTPELLCHLHEILTEKTLDKPDAAGRFRREDEQIFVADAITGDPVYTPPSASALGDRIKEICDFANSKSSSFIHPVLKAIALHFALGLVHPFVDGNGRTARAVFYWYMLKNRYWLFEFLPISRIINAAPVQYGRAYLYTETDGGDLTYFNHYHLHVVIRAIDELHVYLVEQQKLLCEAEALLAAHPELNLRQRLLIQNALRHRDHAYTVREHEGKYRITYNTARSDLLGLTEAGLLMQTKRPHGKEVVYYPPHDLRKRLQSAPKSAKKKPAQPRRPRKAKGNTGPSLFDLTAFPEADVQAE
jgi:Fic family protein